MFGEKCFNNDPGWVSTVSRVTETTLRVHGNDEVLPDPLGDSDNRRLACRGSICW